MLVEPGEILLIITRRLFENDHLRQFVGRVKAVTESTVRLEGYPFFFDTNAGEYIKKGRRVRIFALADSGNIIIVIPKDVNLDDISYKESKKGWETITDGNTFELKVKF
jgi:hypothetical protein